MADGRSSQKDKDDRSFPVRILVRLIPVEGVSRAAPFTQMSKLFPPGDAEMWPFRSPSVGECSAAYFRSLDDAARWLAALPGIVELVDGTTSPVYTSPHVSQGRRIR
jgi:hypothetical protein